jgi:hypothetical protein
MPITRCWLTGKEHSNRSIESEERVVNQEAELVAMQFA